MLPKLILNSGQHKMYKAKTIQLKQDNTVQWFFLMACFFYFSSTPNVARRWKKDNFYLDLWSYITFRPNHICHHLWVHICKTEPFFLSSANCFSVSLFIPPFVSCNTILFCFEGICWIPDLVSTPKLTIFALPTASALQSTYVQT